MTNSLSKRRHGTTNAIELSPSLLITDCKSLCDPRKVGHGMPQRKRTAMEFPTFRQNLKMYSTKIRWVNTFEMVADALTKPLFKRCKLDETLNNGNYQIVREIDGLSQDWRTYNGRRTFQKSSVSNCDIYNAGSVSHYDDAALHANFKFEVNDQGYLNWLPQRPFPPASL